MKRMRSLGRAAGEGTSRRRSQRRGMLAAAVVAALVGALLVSVAAQPAAAQQQPVSDPSGVVLAPGDGTLAVSWTPQPGLYHFVRWSVPGSGFWANPADLSAAGAPNNGVLVGLNVSSYQISGLTNGQQYAVHVRASDSQSPFGGQRSAFTRVFGTPAAAQSPGVAATPAGLTLAEGASGQYRLALTSRPTHNVTVAPASSDSGAATVVPASLVFTPTNWGTAQAVTVTAAGDAGNDDEVVTISHTATSDDSDYSGLPAARVTVAVDDDEPSSDAALSGLALSAAGGGIGFASGTADYTVSVHNSVASTTVTATTRHRGATIKTGLSGATAPATSGVAGAAIPLRVGSNVIEVAVTAENAAARTYTVTVKRERPGEARPRNLRLIPGAGQLTLLWDHSDPTITPDPDALGDELNGYKIRWSVAGSGKWSNPRESFGEPWRHSQPTEYTMRGLTDHTKYAVFIAPRDGGSWTRVFGTPAPLARPAGVTLAPGDGELTLTWQRPAAGPYHAVRWREAGSGSWQNPAAGSIAGAPANGVLIEPGKARYRITGLANAKQYEVQLKARPDSGRGERPGSASTAGTAWVAASAAPAASAKTFSIADTTAREGDDATLTVTLSRPAAPGAVAFTVAADFSGSASESDAGAVPARVTVPKGQRSASFIIPIAADQAVEAAETFTVAVAPTASGWTAAASAASSGTATVTIAGPDATVTPTSLTVDEGASADYTVALTSAPTHDVTVTVTSSDTGAATVSPTSLTFTPSNWWTAQTVTVSAVADTDSDDEHVALTHTFASDDPAYALVAAPAVSVTVTDAGVAVLADPAALTVVEGDTATYDVALTSAPAHDVVVTPASGDTTIATVSGALTFTAANWRTPQPVTVTGVADSDSDSETVTVTHTITSDDTTFAGLTAPSVSVAVTDKADLPSDATLGALELSASGRGIGFASATTRYTTRVHQSVASTTVTATAHHPAATMTVGLRGATPAPLADGTPSDPIALSLGRNVIEVAVTAPSGAATTYAVEVLRERAAGFAPRDARLIAGSARLTLVWDPAPDSDGALYTVRWRRAGSDRWLNPNGAGGVARISADDRAEYSITGLANGTMYAVQIKASKSGRGQSRWVEVLGAPGALAAPTGVALTPGDGEMTVTWDAPPDDVYHAVRWRCANVQVAGCLNPVGDSILLNQANGVLIEPGATSYTITGLTNGRQYVAAVQARPSAGQGETPGAISTAGTSWVRATGAPAAGTRTYSLSGARVIEGGDAALAVTLSEAAPRGGVAFAISADFAGTASAADAGSVPAAVTVPAGERRATFTVAAVADAETENSEAFTVVVATEAPGWTAAAPAAATATVTITDGPAAAPEVSLATAAVEVDEGAGHAAVTVQVAGSNPAAAEVALAVADGTAVRGSDYGGAATATMFVPAGPNGASATLTIPITDDADTEDDETFTVTITGVSDGHSITSPDTATVTIAANDVPPGVTADPSALAVPLSGQAAYTVVLDTKPTTAVTVTPHSSDRQSATTSGAVTFSPSEWDTPKEITVSGLKATDEALTITHRVASADRDYSGITADSVSATVKVRSFSIADAAAAEGEDAQLDITLSEPAPAGGVAFSVAVGYGGTSPASAQDLGTPLPSAATVDEGETTARITVPVADDDITEPSETFSVTVSTSASGWVTSTQGAATATVTVTDDDTAGVTVTAQDPVSIDEGRRGTYTVVLDSEPTAAVTVSPRSSDPQAARTSGAVTFQPSQWQTPKTITVYGQQDRDNLDEEVTIAHTASGAFGYGAGLAVDSVTVAVNDDEPGVTVTAQDPVSIGEGATATYTVVLNTRPSAAVTVSPRSSDPQAARTSGAVTFQPSQWQTPKTITVHAQQDDDNLDETVTITHIASGAVGYFSSLAIDSVSVTVTDDEAKSTDASLSSLSLSAGGVSHDITQFGEATAFAWTVPSDAASVTVTPVTADTHATVTVNGTAVASGTASSAIALSAGANTVSVVVTAQDTTTATYTITVTRAAAPSALTLTAASSTVGEGAGTLTVTATLDTLAGAAGVAVTLSAASTSTANAGTDFTLPGRFTIAEGDTSATANIAIADDAVDEGDETIVLDAATAAGIAVTGASVTITDNDADTATLVFTAPSRLRVAKGDTGTYLVALGSEPAAAVAVKPVSADTAVATVSGTVTFTAQNWDTPQPVTVTGVKAAAVSITHTVTSDDATYDGLASDPLSAVVEDADGDAALASLELSAAPGGIDFASGVPVYMVSAHRSLTSTTVTAQTRHPGATITAGLRGGNPHALTGGVAGDPIVLSPGRNVIDVVVTAPDGTQRTYVAVVTSETAAPAAPRNVRLIPGAGTLTVLWDHADPTKAPSTDRHDVYNVRWSIPGSGVWGNPQGSGGERHAHNLRTEYTFSGLVDGTEYAVHVRANDQAPGGQSSTAGPWVRVFGTPGALDAPTGVALTPGDGELTVTWDAPPDDVYHAVRWRCADGHRAGCRNPLSASILGHQGNGVLIEPGAASHTITGLTNGQQYVVEVKARPSAGHGERRGPSSAGSSWVEASGAPAAGAKTYSLSGATAREGGDAVLAVTLSEAAPQDGIAFSIAPDFSGTASAADAGNIPISVTVPSAASRATFAIPIERDAGSDGGETFTVTVTAAAAGWTADGDTATVTILDGPAAPQVSLKDTAISVDEDAGTATVTVRVVGHNPAAAEVALSVTDGTAARGADYGGDATASVLIPAGQKGASARLAIPITDDDDTETDETFTVTITGVSASHAVGSPATATVTIADDDEAAGITSDPSTLEVPRGRQATYTVVLDSEPTHDVTITPRSSDRQSATTSGPVTFRASGWATPKQITVYGHKVTSESLTITHTATSADSRYSGLTATLTVTVAEAESNNANLSALELSAGAIAPDFDPGTAAYTLSVPNSTASTTVTATVADTGKATVKAGLRGSLAAAVSAQATGALSLSAGANTVEVEVTAEDGTTAKTYAVTVTRGGTGAPGAPAGLSAEPGTGSLAVTWRPPTDLGANDVDGYDVQYKTTTAADQAATTADDPSTGWVDAGHTGTGTAATVSGLTNGTSYDIRVRATNGAASGGAWATVSAAPVEPPIKITKVTAGGSGELVIEWERGPGVDTGYYARWRVKSPQGPWIPSDRGRSLWRTGGVTLTGFTPGETYEIQVNGLNFANYPTPTAWSPIAEGTAGEAAKTYSIASAATAEEGDAAELAITLSEAAPAAGVEFSVQAAYGSGADAAGSGDVGAHSATVTVPDGETSATVSIPIARDADEEGDETFTVTVAPTGTGATDWTEASNGDGTATVTITDTTETVRFKRAKVKLGETRDPDGGDDHTVRITRTGDTARALEVTLTFTDGTATSPDGTATSPDGTATSPDDYKAAERTVTFPSGKRFRDVRLRIVDDKIDEDDETFTVTLATGTSGYIAGEPLVVKIADDDTAGVELPVTALTVTEKETVTYELKLASKPTADVTITATSGDPQKIRLGRDPAKTRTFTPKNWNKAQTFTVRAKPVGDAEVTISHAAVSDDAKYHDIDIEAVVVTVTDVYELPDAVNDLQFTVDGTSVTVTWTAPDAPDQVDRYYVKVIPADGTAGEPKEKRRRPRAAGEQMSETFRNLVPGATYVISVRATGAEGKGERTWTQSFTVPPAEQPDPEQPDPEQPDPAEQPDPE